MAYVYQKSKKYGTIYVYENKPYWDSEKKQSRAHRKLIGKLDPVTNEIIPTRPAKPKKKTDQAAAKPGPDPITETKRYFFGVNYLLDQIGKTTGVEEDLKAVFPQNYREMLAIAYYLIQSDQAALSRFPNWAKLHKIPTRKEINSQRSSDLFQSITEEQKMSFFKKQAQRRAENEYWAFDTTSISSYSETLSQVKKGHNKENDPLPQLNLALLSGAESGLPFYYRKLPGNITDVSILNQLLAELDWLDLKKVKISMDRGFYSKQNLNSCFEHHQKFLIGARTSLNLVKEAIEAHREELQQFGTLLPQFGIHGVVDQISWEYEVNHPKAGKELKKRRAYLMTFYNDTKASQDRINFDEHLNTLYNDLLTGQRHSYWEKEYERYFEVKETPKRGLQITPKEEQIKAKRDSFGFFALLSNEIKDVSKALSLYRHRDIVEKGFNNIKDRLNMRRLQVSSELSLNGKIFVEFIALIYLSSINKRMQEAKLYDKWTMPGLIDELNLIEVFETPDHKRIMGEITKKQQDLFKSLKIPVPSL